MSGIFNYINRESIIHKMSGATKLIVLILWSLAAMTSFDTRFLACLPILAFILFSVSKIKFKDVKFLLWFTFVFMILNNILIKVIFKHICAGLGNTGLQKRELSCLSINLELRQAVMSN